ncbi:MAG TPA: GNAT family N-acetyltransferase [Pedococcus sp.]|nr:GNAT family N-acetyltransferase [Pedococcus sp.]
MPDSTLTPSVSLPTLKVRRAGAEDRPVLERMWLLFRHDLSQFTGDLPRADGASASERLDAALTDPGWAAFLACCECSPVSFAFVRSLERQPFVLNSFFVVAAARGTGVGSAVAHQVVTTFPGTWEVAFQEANSVATHFWRKVAAAHGPGLTEERRAMPLSAHLPADSWITFEARGQVPGRGRTP